MNETAKKLRDIAQNAVVTTGSGKPYSVIATIKSAFGFDSMLAPGVLLQFMAAIADEMDELQAEANDANNLRQKLDSAEKKAERRKRHIGYLETALHDKNALLEQRGGTIARLTAECSGLRKQVPSERERRILDIWPRFEDGKPVMVGDRFIDHKVNERTVRSVIVNNDGVELRTFDGTFDWHETGERVKSPVQSVLDADGVEIKVGDTVWFKGNPRPYAVVEVKDGSVRLHSKTHCSEESATTVWTDILTHIAPDSWEQLEEDAGKEPCDYFGVECDDDKGCGGCPHLREGRDCTIALQADLIRRAKALAGVEVGR